ncbi:NAD(P)/FAD-dependent oxidoreductase [Pyrobaculum ferrireducens]|uniref:FAD dependent oxidoreductase n=1 Tax=Pyrobaculum ferrireducens TaxID=1104324 RepID=G7VFK9_9CREN|nr:FAD-binding oxidoreductase [Pyrobaculum ferrireducens]AET34215.1 FAD dependent oxidoreductase [Pyrobaculum ferrireducens]
MKVVVLGGGIAGVFVAYFLRERGFDVIGIGGELTYPLTSLVLTTSMPHVEDVELAWESLEIYRRFTHLSEVTSVDILPRWVDLSPLSRVPHDVVDRVEGLRLDPDEIAVVTTDYLVPVRRVVNALRKMLGFSEDYGLLKVEGGRAYVVANGRKIEGDVVVLAAGYRNSLIAREVGLEVPLAPYECYAVLSIVSWRARRYSIGDYVLGWYGRPAAPPFYIAGDGCGRYGEGPPPNYADRMGNLMSKRLGVAVPLYVKTGYCEVGPHGGPLYGKYPGLENLYVIGGFNGYGSMVGPALARRLADLVAGGGADDVFRLEKMPLQRRINPCEVAERHDWGGVLLRNS